jgi:3-dehydroquinate synthase
MGKLLREVRAETSSAVYSIVIGSGIAADALAGSSVFKGEPSAFIVSTTVYNLHTAYIDSFLKKISGSVLILFEDSEANKSFTYAGPFLNRLAEAGLNRRSVVVSIGGGVTGDFAGFIASIYMRGIKVIHVPTTLLAMVDASMGGKTAVNIDVGKNMTGTFHQPSLVLSDTKFLSTLPYHEMANGLTEALKHALIGDSRSLEILNRNDTDIVNKESELIELIAASAEFKTGVVQKDERESGLRAILNFGHTVGHAIESLMNYTGISHGAAVAAGIEVKTYASNTAGQLSDNDRELILSLISRYSLRGPALRLDPEDICEHMKYDKKNSAGTINLVTLEKIGKPLINTVIERQLMIESIKKVIGGKG